jgi:uncharacterized protein
MAKFLLSLVHEPTSENLQLVYDNIASTISSPDGSVIDVKQMIASSDVVDGVDTVRNQWKNSNSVFIPPLSTASNRKEKGNIKTVKIQLGLGCNYSCNYCLQSANNDSDANPKDVDTFLAGIEEWVGCRDDLTFDFRGGEPFVYWKTLKPLAEQLRTKYPNARFAITTNGSLLTIDKAKWLVSYGFFVSVSHDGPGQAVRGEDPLRGASWDAIQYLHRVLPKGRFSIGAMLTRQSHDREDICSYFIKRFNDPDIQLSEGAFVDIYDESQIEHVLYGDDGIAYRRKAFKDFIDGRAKNFGLCNSQAHWFLDTLHSKRDGDTVPQKCGMDAPTQIAVDMKGNVLTCQNVNKSQTGIDGLSHQIGNISDFDNINLNTVKPWKERPNCSGCPVLQICKGSCMLLDDKMFSYSCENSFNDAIVYFAHALHILTGFTLVKIEGDTVRNDRIDIFGLFDGQKSKNRIIPLKVLK